MANEAELLKGVPKYSYKMKEDIWISMRHLEKMASKDLTERIQLRRSSDDIFQYKYRMQCASQFNYLHKEIDMFWVDSSKLIIAKTSANSSYKIDLFVHERQENELSPLKTITHRDNGFESEKSNNHHFKFDKSNL